MAYDGVMYNSLHETTVYFLRLVAEVSKVISGKFSMFIIARLAL